MKRLSLLLVSLLMLSPVVDAQSRSSRGNHSSQSSSRPGQGAGNQHNTRPGNNGNNNGGNRPGSNNGNGQSVRPGNNGGNNNMVRPGNNNTVRPGNNGGYGHDNQYRPTTPSRPGDASVRPGYQAPSRPVTVVPPVRPYRPQFNAWTRPVVPNGWTPRYRQPLFSDILGLTVGVTLHSALDYLYNTGYSVDGYGQQEIYLRNVSQSGYRWDDATLYFSSGMMVRSQFYDMTAGYSPSRYYDLYNQYCVRYGAPATQVNNQGFMTATWFGYSGEYVMLQYSLMATSTGQRYVTQLVLGN